MKTQVERMTKQELLHHWLTGCLGGAEVPCRSKKYRAYRMPAPMAINGCYFTGKNGALRCGDSASRSVSLTPRWTTIKTRVEQLLEREREMN